MNGTDPGPRWFAPLAFGSGLAIVPWIVRLAVGPSPHRLAGRLAWVTLDVAEAALLVATGVRARRGNPRWRHNARNAAALLVADAAIDLATARGPHVTRARWMAALVELPGAAVLLGAARRPPLREHRDR